ncbi:MAG: SgcJ/EcaC family oxidoreductase, partial [Verrucomicrobia bacterium]|nr:SgcJ/EcaC family oxidoreductase [Verrucomicrobiota bacterium]
MTFSTMRRFTIIPFLVFTLSLWARGADVANQNSGEQPIYGLIAAFGEAFAKLDAHAFAMVFHEDADFTNVWGMTAHGRQAIEEFHRPLLEGDGAGPVPSFKRAELKV